MHLSSQWFVAQAISSIRHGIGSRLAFEIAGRGRRRVSPRRADSDASLHGFAVTVRSATGVAVDDTVGCNAQVLAGQAWITADGAPQDIIAGVGAIVPLEPGVRYNVGAFRDRATVLITAPQHSHDVGFSLQRRNGVRVLTVTSTSRRLPSALSGIPAAVAAFVRRCFAGTRTASV